MKINIQKVIKCLTCLVTCFMVVLGALCSPVSALTLNSLDLADYVSDVEYNAESKTVTYCIDGITPFMCCWQYTEDGVLFSGVNNDYTHWQLEQDADQVYFGIFPLGARVRDGYDLVNGDVVLDISDITPGSPLSFYANYHFVFYPENTFAPCELHFSATMYYFMYDASGKFIGKNKYYTGSYVMSDAEYYPVDYMIEDDLIFPVNCAYICPFVHINCYDDLLQIGSGWRFALEQYGFELSTDISYIVENSSSMNAIKDKLDGIDESLDDLKDTIDSGMESVGDSIDNAKDEILSGTPEQNDKAEDFGTDVDNATQGLESVGDALNGMPAPDIDVNEIIPSDRLTSTSYIAYTAIFAQLWDMDLLYTMLSLLGMFSVVSYLIFASKR